MICDYGCGQEAKYPFKNGKWCCSRHWSNCPVYRKKKSIEMKKARKNLNSIFNSKSYRENQSKGMKEAHKNPNSRFNLNSYIENLSKKMKKLRKDPNSTYNSKSYREKLGKSLKLTIERINKKYPFFIKIEQMRYNPDKPNEKEIQVHCKNHECKNSKEKGGWFTPSKIQLYERIRQIESKEASGGCYFYCSQYCKDTCPLYNLHGDPYNNSSLPYTYQEYQTCRTIVFERENGLCEYCGEPATHMHHIFPVKIEPFFVLDPDYCIACCEKHHYKYAHKDECSTGNLAKIVCSVESQKFLNQTLENI